MAGNFGNLVNAAVFSGATQSIAQGVSDNITPEGQAARSEARTRKAEMDQKLRQLKATAPTDEDLVTQSQINSQELQKTKEQNNQILATQTKARIFDSFDRYVGDNDTRHLNTMLQDMRTNPYGQKLFGSITRVDPVTEADAGELQKAGVDPDLVLNNPEFRNRLVKATNADGSQKIHDMNSLFKITGYTRYAQNQELEVEQKRANILKAYAASGAKTSAERLAYDRTKADGLTEGSDAFQARYIMYRQEEMTKEKAGKGSGDPAQTYKSDQEREAYRLTIADGYDPKTSAGQDKFVQHYQDIQKRNHTPSAVKQADEVSVVTQNVADKAKAEGRDFFDIDFGDRKNRLEYEPQIQKIEKLGGFELSADQRKDLGYIKSLIKLGPPSQKLNDDETGLVDNLLFNTKKYMSDNVKGVDATSAYATFRNTIRHALYGSALTDSEIASFEEQFGNLKQQRGPVLAQLKTAVEQTQAKIDSLYSLGNSYVTHFRLGADQKALGTMVSNLDKLLQRLDALGADITDDTPVGSTKPAATSKARPSLDDIFGGAPAK